MDVLIVFELLKAGALALIVVVALFAAYRLDKVTMERDMYKELFHRSARMRMVEQIGDDNHER